MTNKEALRAQCKLICNNCYVDSDVLELALLNSGVIGEEEVGATNDPTIIRTAIIIVKGWVETSRSENGISTTIDINALDNNIKFWCAKAGLDASEFVDSQITFESGSDFW